MSDFIIEKVRAREIIDSRGNPTVEVDVYTKKGFGRDSVPSGASVGAHEALELRDGGRRFWGMGVLRAVESVNEVIAPRIIGMDAREQEEIDGLMVELDGTENKSRLGANAILGVSLAVARAAADTAGTPLYEYLRRSEYVMPVPLMNVINGGKHAGNLLSVQEFIIIPVGAGSFREALRTGSEVYHVLKSLLKERYGLMAVNVGDEGGFTPPMRETREALDALRMAVERSGREGEVLLAIDAAALSFYENGLYRIDGRSLTGEELLEFYERLADEYPIASIEDPFHEEDFEGFSELTRRLGRRVQIVGDDLFATNPRRLARGVDTGAANALLLKVNQIGTLTEAMHVAELCFRNRYRVVVSHRSGETESTTIADIAVALGCGQIKTGAPARGERTAKYNRLLRIEEELGRVEYPGLRAIRGG